MSKAHDDVKIERKKAAKFEADYAVEVWRKRDDVGGLTK